MKTTLDKNDDMLRTAKLQAATSGVTEQHFQLDLPVVQGERAPAVDVANRGALYDFLETSPGTG